MDDFATLMGEAADAEIEGLVEIPEIEDTTNPIADIADQEHVRTLEAPPSAANLDAATQIADAIKNQHQDPNVLVPTLFITGAAGTGKTYSLRQIISENPAWAILAATTGIAGVNLDTTTIHALLRYFDTDSLQESYRRGRLQTLLHVMAYQFENIAIDEASMIDGLQLDIWYRAFAEVNEFADMAAKGRKLGLILTGDFCQLPPVKADWAFNAESWQFFARNVVRLTKVWRQGDARFLEALNFLRAGDGGAAVEILKDLVHWRSSIDMKMKDATVIMAKNDAVDRHNWMMLRELTGPYIDIPSRRGGKVLKAWEQHIPEKLQLKEGAYVMILTNAAVQRGFFDFNTELPYANGDCGWVRAVNMQRKTISIQLKRNKEIVEVPMITRLNYSKEPPEYQSSDGFKPYIDGKTKKWVVGQITYMPLRLAYAATVHKTQGLTLDKIQVDSTAHFFGTPAMAYVSLSRARKAEEVYIVGTPEKFIKKVKVDPQVIPWL